MADKKISELVSITGSATAADDYFVVVDTSGAVTYKISREELNNAIEQDVLENISITNLTSDLNTNGNDINFGDNDKAIFGAGSDLQIYHDASDSYIVDGGTGNLRIQGHNIYLMNAAGTEVKIRADDDSFVKLYFDNAEKLATTATGVDVTGTVTADGVLNNNKSEFFASESALVSTGSTAKVYATNSTFDGINGSLVLQSRPTSGADVYIATGATPKKVAKFDDGGDISFYDSTGVTQGLFWDASTQRLGLGTTSPSVPLHVKASSAEFSLQASAPITSGSRASFNAYNSDVSTVGYVRFGAVTDNVGTDIQFANRPAGGSVTERMRIDSSGRVGIGRTPTITNSKLEVGGADNVSLINVEASGVTGGMGIGSTGLQFFHGSSAKMRIDSSGNLLLQKTSATNSGAGTYFEVPTTPTTMPVYLHFCKTHSGARDAIDFNHNGSRVGSIQFDNTSTSYNTSSDYRLKTAVNYDWDATTRLKQLRPARFEWIADGDDAVPVDGFLAHEVQDVVPEAISGTHNEVDDEGNPVYQGIDQSKLVPLLVKTIQELEARITALEAN